MFCRHPDHLESFEKEKYTSFKTPKRQEDKEELLKNKYYDGINMYGRVDYGSYVTVQIIENELKKYQMATASNKDSTRRQHILKVTKNLGDVDKIMYLVDICGYEKHENLPDNSPLQEEIDYAYSLLVTNYINNDFRKLQNLLNVKERKELLHFEDQDVDKFTTEHLNPDIRNIKNFKTDDGYDFAKLRKELIYKKVYQNFFQKRLIYFIESLKLEVNLLKVNKKIDLNINEKKKKS